MASLCDTFAFWTQTPASLYRENGWRFFPLQVSEELAGIASVRGTEIHFAVAPEWRHRLITRARTRAFLAPLFDYMGFLTTRVMEHDEKGQRFVKRLGFQHTHTEAGIQHYMLTELPFGKEQSCPS